MKRIAKYLVRRKTKKYVKRGRIAIGVAKRIEKRRHGH